MSLVKFIAGLAAAVVVAAGASAQPRADFFRALEHNDANALRTAMLRGVSSNVRDDEGTPAIVRAAREKAWNIVRALGELRGTDIEALDKVGATALMYACLHGDLPTARFLVARGSEVNRVGWTPLHYAAANGHVEVVRYLLEVHAYIDAESPNRTTPLMMAVRQEQRTTAQLLLAEGADPTIRNQSGLTAVDYARHNRDKQLTEALTLRAEEFSRKYGVPAAR